MQLKGSIDIPGKLTYLVLAPVLLFVFYDTQATCSLKLGRTNYNAKAIDIYRHHVYTKSILEF